MPRLFLYSVFACFDVYSQYSRNRPCNRQGDKVYPTEFHVFEARKSGEDKKREQHVQQPRNSAFEKPVLRVFETYQNADEHGQNFDCDVYG